MKVPIYHLDAFTDRLFAGNPAAVCPLPDWADDEVLQAIAAENNLSETAFFVHRGDHFQIRWFTPATEVDLCGHATLAAAFVIFHHLEWPETTIRFLSRGGPLGVEALDDLIRLDFPAAPATPAPCPEALARGLGRTPEAVLQARDWLAVLGSEAELVALAPDMAALRELDRRGVIVTAPAAPETGADFVCRFFAPGIGVPEDPVTGSAFCSLAPYWAARLGRADLRVVQRSARGGEAQCEHRGDRVLITGRAVCYLRGELSVRLGSSGRCRVD